MNQSRQQAFQRLRPPCVELSSVALKFKANQSSAKAVLLALEQVHHVLLSLGDQNLLDEKLAEYAFFPLTHIFNQSQRLSSRGLEIAVRCVQILVSKGWRDRLVPQMAKQLLILMGLLVSRNPQQQIEPATDELKVASFECMAVLIRQNASTTPDFLDGLSGKNIVDQLVYQLLEAVTDASSEQVQITAAHALVELQRAIKNPALLASILPRSVSTLVKVLRPSTQARRTRKVLIIYLRLLTELLANVLADEVIFQQQLPSAGDTRSANAPGPDDGVVLDKSWLDATSPQIDLALVQVVKLKTHEGSDVAEALLGLCLTVINDCSQTLARSIPLMVETLAVLCRSSNDSKANAALKHLITSRPEMADVLSAKFYDWSQALPRVMQGSDDRPKTQLLKQIATSFIILTDTSNFSDEATSRIASILIDTVTAAIGSSSRESKLVNEAPQISSSDLIQQHKQSESEFMPVFLSHRSQASSTAELKSLIICLNTYAFSQNITRSLVDNIHDPNVNRKLSAAWLALQMLKTDGSQAFDVMELIEDDSSISDLSVSRPFLISDLYSNTLPFLTEYPGMTREGDTDWRLVALSLESLILQASQLAQSYRPELMETLFPLLTLLGSRNALLQQHAMTALNLLAAACEYDSAAHMLIENVDYLINAVALRLNAFDVSRNGLQVIAMMIRLCGAKLLPHLDDLIGSIFGALDNFHGYPNLVEQLFEVLKMVVAESSKSPAVLAIECARGPATHKDKAVHVSRIEDIFIDLKARKHRKSKSDEEHELITTAPRRPWTIAEDSPPDSELTRPTDEDDSAGGDRPLEYSTKKGEAKTSKSHQLLLNIAQSTVPHMSSPSPKVRLTLLELLQDISPMLALHENSFLPLVNSIWPVVVSMLLNKDDGAVTDVAYNVRAAAITIAAICRAAGDFMSSRVEEIFSELELVFKRTYSSVVRSTKHQKPTAMLHQKTEVLDASTDNLVVPKQEEIKPNSRSALPLYFDAVRTSDSQALEAFVTLLVTILQQVRISEDNADKVFWLLTPFMHTKTVREALFNYNEDAGWLIEHYPSQSHPGRSLG